MADAVAVHLEAVGVPPALMPPLDVVLDAVLPVACKLDKARIRARRGGKRDQRAAVRAEQRLPGKLAVIAARLAEDVLVGGDDWTARIVGPARGREVA
jgi:membrane protein implicated in regulation of membrane protease activity